MEPTRSIDISRAEATPGWMHRRELAWLAERARESAVIVEVGAWLGRTTRVFADHTAGQVVAIDPWDGYTNDDGTLAEWMLRRAGGSWAKAYQAFRSHVADALKDGRVSVIRKPSLEAAPVLARKLKGQLADFIFLDGDHRYEAVLADIHAFAPFVKPGGILAGHDYGRADWPGVQRAVDGLFEPVAVNIVRTIWWVRR